jgi:hypothetical protein
VGARGLLIVLQLSAAWILVALGQVPAPLAESWAEVLHTSVREGRVDYKGIDQKKLGAYLAAVGELVLPEDRNLALGAMVDAYNALVIARVIADHRPRSVLDDKDFFTARAHRFAKKSVSLDELEKQILLPFAKDPRVHMVLVCGAVSCPILEDRPYAGDDVARRMEAAARRYLAGPTGAMVEPGAARISKIFDWYKADFGGDAGVLAFLQAHLSEDEIAKLGPSPKITYLEYNWTLNQR